MLGEQIMQVLANECLKKYTTVRIGGYANQVYFPESTDELIELIDDLIDRDYYILGGGSNILMNDKKTYDNVIVLTKFNNTIRNLGDGKYYVGASTMLQKLINTVNQEGYGGIEYLYSVPGLVGGAIVMNAGRGKQFGLCISDYIKDVHCYEKGSVFILKKDECKFAYRDSIFKNNKTLVLGATFCFDKMEISASTRAKQERLALCRTMQDNSGYNFGSVFMKSNWRLMQLVRFLNPGFKKGMAFSNKTLNWLINNGDGTFLQAIMLITAVKKLHKILRMKTSLEIIIWK